MAQPMNISQYLEYVGNEWAAGWLQRSLSDRKGVFVAQAYMHMTGGNGNDAIMLGQILYWHDISQETQSARITHWFDGHLWIVHTHEELSKQTGINVRTVRRSLDRLAELGLIIKEQHRSTFPEHKGAVVSFVRVNWNVFGQKMQSWAESQSEPVQTES